MNRDNQVVAVAMDVEALLLSLLPFVFPAPITGRENILTNDLFLLQADSDDEAIRAKKMRKKLKRKAYKDRLRERLSSYVATVPNLLIFFLNNITPIFFLENSKGPNPVPNMFGVPGRIGRRIPRLDLNGIKADNLNGIKADKAVKPIRFGLFF